MFEAPSYVEALDALAAGDSRLVREWLGEQLGTGPDRTSPDDLHSLDTVARWTSELSEAMVCDSLDRLLRSASRVRMAAPLLLLYVKALCERAWESIWDVTPLLSVMTQASVTWRSVRAADRPADPVPTGLALRALDLLQHKMATLNAGNCGTLSTWARFAGQTSELAGQLHDEARWVTSALGHDDSGLATMIAASADEDVRYFGALAVGAEAAHLHFTTGGTDPRIATRALLAAEGSFPDGIERAELRAHRLSMEALAAVADRPWLRVEHGSVVCLYPFGLFDGQDAVLPTATVETFDERTVRLAREHALGWTIVGCTVGEHPHTQVNREYALDDIWQGGDPMGRRYQGMSVTLPDLETVDPDRPDGGPIRIGVELRLSILGNHYIRLECPLGEATPPQLYAALCRFAPESGDLLQLGTPIRLRGPGQDGRAWARLADFATDVIGDVARSVSDMIGSRVVSTGRSGAYHVLTTINRAVLVDPVGDGIDQVYDARTAVRAPGGQALCHPVKHGIGALAEWLRYPTGEGDLPVVKMHGFAGDLVLRTCNTTTVFLPGTPSYLVGTVVEAAEFVASIEGIFEAWGHRVASHYEQLRAQFVSIGDGLGAQVRRAEGATTSGNRTAVAELAELQGRLESQQLVLQRFVMASRLSLTFVTSPSLVTSPVIRETLDSLLAAARFEDLRTGFEGLIEEVLGDRIALLEATVRRQQERETELARAAQERRDREEDQQRRRQDAERIRRDRTRREKLAMENRRERANRYRMDLALGGLAAIGFSGVMQILQAGYDLKKFAAWWLVIAVLLLASAVIGLFYRLHPDRSSGAGEDHDVREEADGQG